MSWISSVFQWNYEHGQGGNHIHSLSKNKQLPHKLFDSDTTAMAIDFVIGGISSSTSLDGHGFNTWLIYRSPAFKCNFMCVCLWH